MVKRGGGCGIDHHPFTKTVHAQSSCICGVKSRAGDPVWSLSNLLLDSRWVHRPVSPSAARRAPSLRRLRAARRDPHRITQIRSLDAERTKTNGLHMKMR
ncbi:hypothetical protein EPR50_G00157200 [Perca flavescens]|uniref:Uncharacterized protein n=1 Tax=Perca flavescens TaxID=8167 RepID=A0A484CHM1_PERFV|nr:hypothetical protein EPR50_G00157200 [Perca flavescens]